MNKQGCVYNQRTETICLAQAQGVYQHFAIVFGCFKAKVRLIRLCRPMIWFS